MNHLFQQGSRPSSLRDYGAFQTDLSALDTLHMVTIEQKSRGTTLQAYAYDPVISTPVLTPSREKSLLQKIAGQKWFRLAARFVITTALLLYLFKSVSWQVMLTALVHVHLTNILIGLVVGSSGVVLSAYQWWGLLRTENIRFDLADLIKLYIIGITFNHFLPTGIGGDAFKAFYVGRESRNNASVAGTVILCRVTGFVGMVLLVFPVLFIWHTRFTFTLVLGFILLCILVGIIIVGSLLLMQIIPVVSNNTWGQIRLFTLLAEVGLSLHKSILRPRSMFGAIMGGALFWLIAVLNCYVYAGALGVQEHLYFYFLAVPLVAIVASMPITINGFGLRESIFVYVFSFAHVAPATALLLVFLLDLQSLFFAVIGCCIYFTSANKTKPERSLANSFEDMALIEQKNQLQSAYL